VRSETDRTTAGSFGENISEGRAGLPNRSGPMGDVAREFHLKLQARPVKTSRHLRRLMNFVRVYGREEVLAAMVRAHQYQTYDAAYVETILLQERRRRELPSPTPLRPRRQELIDDTRKDRRTARSQTGPVENRPRPDT